MKVPERALLFAGTLVMAAVALGVGLVRGNLQGFYFPFSEGLLAVANVVAGSIVTRARPRHAVGRIMLWVGVVLAAAQFAEAFEAPITGDPTSVPDLAGAVGALLRFASIGMLGALIARFPDGGWTTPWARRLFFVYAGLIVVQVGLFVGYGFEIPPIAEMSEEALLAPFLFIPPAGVALTVLVVVHLLRSGPVRRRQVGWVIFAFGIAIALEAIVTVLEVSLGTAGGVIRGLVVSLIPASIVVAVTRYRLYEIDRVLSRTVSYGVVVAAMVGVFLGVVSLLSVVLPLEGDLPVAIATLAAVGVSVPLLRRARAWVERRFFRHRYDAASVVASFASDLRSTIDGEAVVGRVEAVVDEVFNPESVGVWVADP